ncbi:hypothetical protein ERJ75_001705200 [Trypanosoma vivax]|nr:hypothetical protein ERJ75_001705200 [Trypanosoma vivax]
MASPLLAARVKVQCTAPPPAAKTSSLAVFQASRSASALASFCPGVLPVTAFPAAIASSHLSPRLHPLRFLGVDRLLVVSVRAGAEAVRVVAAPPPLCVYFSNTSSMLSMRVASCSARTSTVSAVARALAACRAAVARPARNFAALSVSGVAFSLAASDAVCAASAIACVAAA